MIPDDIRELRRRRNWSHKDLAEAVFASELSAIRWESGTTRPRPAVARRLEELLERDRQRDAAPKVASRESKA